MMPSMVHPAGVVTASFSSAGWLPVCSTICAAPSTVCVARIIAVVRSRPIFTPPSASAFAADFLGVSNRLDATAEAGLLRFGNQTLPYDGPLRGPVLAIVRSSDLSLDAALEHGMVTTLKGLLEESLFLGAHYRHYVRVGDLVLLVDGPAPVKPGAVEIRVPVRRLRVFPPS